MRTSVPMSPPMVERAPVRRQEPSTSVHWGHMRALARLASAATLVAALSSLVVACGGAPASRAVLIPPPVLFRWTELATRTATTPQTAYAAGMRLSPCLGRPGATSGGGDPPRSSAVIWLVTTSSYGLADIQIACAPPAQPPHLWLLELFRDTVTGGWRLMGGRIVGKNGDTTSAGSAPLPTWLPLPADSYVRYDVMQPGLQESPEASVLAWDGLTHLFVFGHIADRAVQPAGAIQLSGEDSSGGMAKWLTSENGLVTVTQELSDGTTRFFAGTSSPASVQTLAADAFAHSSAVLRPL